MAEKRKCGDLWYGCYAGGRGDLFTRESNRHPAKMAVALCYRIFEHGRKMGYWQPGDVILDPLAGIGTTLVVGYSLGYNVIGVELEEHFVRLLALNMVRCVAKLGAQGWFRIVQGDARRLSEILNGGVAAAVASPPYAEGLGHDSGHPRLDAVEDERRRREGCARRSGYSAAVTSPPYAESLGTDTTHGPNSQAARASRQFRHDPYSGAISSPPYTDSISSNKGTFDPEKFVKPGGPHSQANIPSRYSKSHGQIGNLRDPRNDIDGVLSSPPYEDSEQKCDGQKARWTTGKDAALLRRKGDYVPQSSMGRGETYLSAILAVYRELHTVLKPHGVVCLVTKNPVKAGAIRRLDADTIRLMEAAGFTLIERKMAMLSEDLGEQGRLEGGTDKIRRERKSFFKRLFERKRPDLAVDHEDVMFFRKV